MTEKALEYESGTRRTRVRFSSPGGEFLAAAGQSFAKRPLPLAVLRSHNLFCNRRLKKHLLRGMKSAYLLARVSLQLRDSDKAEQPSVGRPAVPSVRRRFTLMPILTGRF